MGVARTWANWVSKTVVAQFLLAFLKGSQPMIQVEGLIFAFMHLSRNALNPQP